VDLEAAICRCAAVMGRTGRAEFHGFELAKLMADAEERRLLTAYGTLYRALARLERMGLLRSRREDPEAAARENRPLRRFYTLTAEGEAAAIDAANAFSTKAPRRQRRRVAPA
jgi:PadR family transcriptional regulator, regulatory protein PadR